MGAGKRVTGARVGLLEVPGSAVPAYAHPVFPKYLEERHKANRLLRDSMICEKQFVPVDDQVLYCSVE